MKTMLGITLLSTTLAHAATVTTVAGNGTAGSADGAAHVATFNRPTWVDVDPKGNIYVVDRENRALRRISKGSVTTLPLFASPFIATPAINFGGPYGGGIAIEPDSAGCGGAEYDAGIYLANGATHQVMLVADYRGTGSGIFLSTREGSPVVGTGIPGATDGEARIAQFNIPGDIALSWDYRGSYNSAPADRIYVADTANHTVRRISMQRVWECTLPGHVSVLAGAAGKPGVQDGPAEHARFNSPRGIAAAPDGSVYVADTGNHTIRRIAPDGMVTTVAGVPGVPGSTDVHLRNPSGIDVNERGEVFIADTGNYVIRKLTTDGHLLTIAGHMGGAGYAEGPAHLALFRGVIGLRVVGNAIYLADVANHAIRKVDLTPAEPRRRGVRH
jgi:NHL repeat